MNLKTQFDGLTLENPLMPASGPLVGDADKLLYMDNEGCGAIVTKTISTKSPDIPKPCIYGANQYVMNSELWSEYPLERWVDEFLPAYKKKSDRPLIVSVGYSEADMKTLIPALDPFADAFEVSTHYVGTDLSVIGGTVAMIRSLTDKPFYMKISPHIPDPEGFARTIKEHGANGIVAINSLGPTLHVNAQRRTIEYGGPDGYVWTTGPVIKNLALGVVYKIKSAEPDLTVIGVGGIASASDVIEFLLAGASAVQMLSAALIKGKQMYAKILSDLPDALEKHGFKSVGEVISTPLENTTDYKWELPRLIEDKCIECMLCEKVCPYFAIEYKDRITFDPDTCTSCGLCVSKCPTDAIKLDKMEG